MDKRFAALRVIGIIFKILAWIALILGLLGGVFVLVAWFLLSSQLEWTVLDLGGPLAGILLFAVILILAVAGFLCLYAIGESAYLLLSIEENTRRAAYFLQQAHTSRQPIYPPPAPPEFEE